MALDPKKIERWGAAAKRLQEDPDAVEMRPELFDLIDRAVPAFLAEREEMISLLREVASAVRSAQVHPPPTGGHPAVTRLLDKVRDIETFLFGER